MSNLIPTIRAIRAIGAPDADLRIARDVLRDMWGPQYAECHDAALETAAIRIAPRMAALAGDALPEALDRVRAELVEGATEYINACTQVVRDIKHRIATDAQAAA